MQFSWGVLTYHIQSSWVQYQPMPTSGMVGHTCNLSPGEVEAEGSDIQDYSQLNGKFEASVGSMEFYTKSAYLFYKS